MATVGGYPMPRRCGGIVFDVSFVLAGVVVCQGAGERRAGQAPGQARGPIHFKEGIISLCHPER